MFKKKQSSKDVNFDEDLCNLKLYSLPPTLQFSSLSSINLNNNKLDQSHLAKLFENAPLLTNIDFQNNRVVCVPRAIVDLKKIKRLNLDVSAQITVKYPVDHLETAKKIRGEEKEGKKKEEKKKKKKKRKKKEKEK
jgi:hypothetical protein